MPETLGSDRRFDLVAFDGHDQPVLAVEVKALRDATRIARDWVVRLESETRSAGRPIPYLMVVDLETIIILAFDGETGMFRPDLLSPTGPVLRAYDPGFEGKRIFDDYLLALVEAWLRDFAFEWRSSNPPFLDELTEIGLAGRLKGGSTHRGVTIADLDPLRRDQFRDEPLLGARFGD